MRKIIILSSLFANIALPVQAQTVTPFSEAQIQSVQNILKEYILSNPELIGQALKELQTRQEKALAENSRKAVEENRKELFERTTDKVMGNSDGSKSLVMFIDPYCGYCQQLLVQVDKAIKTMPDLKVIVKYFPLWGKNSLDAIKCLTAAEKQGKHKEIMALLLKQKEPLSLSQLKKLTQSIKGLDHKRFVLELDNKSNNTLIKENVDLAHKIGIRGLPTIVIGDKIIQGVLSSEQMQALLNSKIDAQPEGKSVHDERDSKESEDIIPLLSSNEKAPEVSPAAKATQ